jgi:hypothetical protein
MLDTERSNEVLKWEDYDTNTIQHIVYNGCIVFLYGKQ